MTECSTELKILAFLSTAGEILNASHDWDVGVLRALLIKNTIFTISAFMNENSINGTIVSGLHVRDTFLQNEDAANSLDACVRAVLNCASSSVLKSAGKLDFAYIEKMMRHLSVYLRESWKFQNLAKKNEASVKIFIAKILGVKLGSGFERLQQTDNSYNLSLRILKSLISLPFVRQCALEEINNHFKRLIQISGNGEKFAFEDELMLYTSSLKVVLMQNIMDSEMFSTSFECNMQNVINNVHLLLKCKISEFLMMQLRECLNMMIDD